MIEFVEGDMFAIEADIRVNTVNCVGAMGAGVALAFKRRYPEMFKAYQSDCKSGNIQPGKMHIWKSLTGDWIINFPTKRDWRDPSRYEDIESGLVALREYLQKQNHVKVALPALGCGNGGLDWSIVSTMIESSLSGLDAHIKVFAPSASRIAGHAADTMPTEDEIGKANQIGFSILAEHMQAELGAVSPIFYNGDQQVLAGPWVTLIPSRSPGEREVSAIEAIAKELASNASGVRIALILNNTTSENLAKLFAERGVRTLLVLPFGVLTRKSLENLGRVSFSGKLSLLSIISPSERWSNSTFSKTFELFLKKSCATIITDPSPGWLIAKNRSTWQHRPIFYLNYGHLDEPARSALLKVNATGIGKNAATGRPNLMPVLDLCG